ncbi:MAG: sensor domain-containing diguanylate cyclase [Pseudomonadota bacterium]|nr:sensor domain-containing diguanylate cyclase [Pseudomonadota bacterium]
MDEPLQRLVGAQAAPDSLENLTRPMLELLEEVTGLESTYLTTIDLGAGIQRILFSRNSQALNIPEGLAVPWGDTLCKRALEEGRAHTDDVAGCWGDSEAARALGINTYLSQPVRMQDGDLFGTLCAASANRVALDSGTINVLAKFAKLIAQQVERERALHQVQLTNTELSRHALADPLTGLANRRRMEQELRRMLAHTQRRSQPLMVAFVDLDGFKTINDRHGHDVGDQFLVHIARKLVAAVRAEDLVARTGGDEFVVLAQGTSTEVLAKRLEDATAGHFSYDGCVIDYAGASVGVAQATDDECDSTDLLKRADAEMYAAKRARKSGLATPTTH